MPGLVVVWGKCLSCGEWMNSRELVDVKPGDAGKGDAPGGTCADCQSGGGELHRLSENQADRKDSAENNTFYGSNGPDKMYGKGGSDEMNGEAGRDWLFGQDGRDRWISGGGGRDVIYLGNGGDKDVFGDSGNDTIRGDPGNDVITNFGGPGGVVYGGPGFDRCYVQKGDKVSGCERRY